MAVPQVGPESWLLMAGRKSCRKWPTFNACTKSIGIRMIARPDLVICERRTKAISTEAKPQIVVSRDAENASRCATRIFYSAAHFAEY